MRILLVDDDTSVLQVLLAILKTIPDHEIRGATSGQKALEIAKSLGGVDLLITDVVMDPMDGFSLCTQIVDEYPGTRTIFLSGYDLSEYAESLKHYQFLQKPVTPEVLITAVQSELAAAKPVAIPAAAGAAPSHTGAATTRASVAQPRAAAPLPPAPRATVSSATIPQARATAPQVHATAYQTPAPAATTMETNPALTAEDSSAGLIGHMIGGYQIVTQLGEGRWGTVYAAVQTSINRPVGLKVLDPVRARDEGQRQRFIADARAKANVQHPSILAVYEAGSADGWIFYTHEYVDGHNLVELAQAGRTLDEPTLLKILRAVADGFIYLTRNNLLHAPLDGSDIYLSVDNVPRLANLATSHTDIFPTPDGELRALGQAVLPLAPAEISTGLRALLTRLSRGGSTGFTAWGALAQAVKALEPKVVPVEAAKISAQDRAAEAAIEAARRQQKRSMIINLASMGTLLLLAAGLIYWKFGPSNERDLGAQVEIPAGAFLFGEGTSMNTGQFWIDKYEVTIGQYAKFVEFIKANPEREKDFDHKDQPPNVLGHIPKYWDIWYENAKRGTAARSVKMSLNSPMLEVSWWDAYAYAKWRGRELPTEQEWEKAARGTRGFLYPWGDSPDEKKANTGEDHLPGDPKQKGKIDGHNFWCDVDGEQDDKSPYGVIGMAGNMSEWTADRTPDNRFPIIKGGNYAKPLKSLADRMADKDANTTAEWIGFRTISRSAPAPAQ
jgi:formylglycine-generating enzyme required for sulfatase activity/CheY-like chemotaxis protein